MLSHNPTDACVNLFKMMWKELSLDVDYKKLDNNCTNTFSVVNGINMV